MAKKIKKTKITETLVTQLQDVKESPVIEEQQEPVVIEEEKKIDKKRETPRHHDHKKKHVSQKSKSYITQVPQRQDSETFGISLGLGGIL